jgi:DNA (cytosine-5)-methyltransferase 1
MSKPRLLDLFCGAGGAAMGYSRAGFDVVGVDIKPQPHYPFEFHQADAMTFPLDGFDAIHASPPCQDHSMARNSAGLHGTGWMLEATMERLRVQAAPWIVENVEGARMPTAMILCGATFGLGASGMDLPRHRQFETSWAMLSHPCSHRVGHTMGVYGHGTNAWHSEQIGRNLTVAEMREAMGVDWMTRDELNQAIPPAMTEWIGLQLLAALERAA